MVVESSHPTHVQEGSLEPEGGGIHKFMDFKGLCYESLDGCTKIIRPKIVEHADFFLVVEFWLRCEMSDEVFVKQTRDLWIVGVSEKI